MASMNPKIEALAKGELPDRVEQQDLDSIDWRGAEWIEIDYHKPTKEAIQKLLNEGNEAELDKLLSKRLAFGTAGGVLAQLFAMVPSSIQNAEPLLLTWSRCTIRSERTHGGGLQPHEPCHGVPVHAGNRRLSRKDFRAGKAQGNGC
eukprot:1218381-Rhodomonas_salina.3